MQIYGPVHLHGPQQIGSPHGVQQHDAPQPRTTSQSATEVDISDTAQFLGQVQDLPEIRSDRVAELREQIASGDYDTDEKLEIALDRLAEELFG